MGLQRVTDITTAWLALYPQTEPVKQFLYNSVGTYAEMIVRQEGPKAKSRLQKFRKDEAARRKAVSDAHAQMSSLDNRQLLSLIALEKTQGPAVPVSTPAAPASALEE